MQGIDLIPLMAGVKHEVGAGDSRHLAEIGKVFAEAHGLFQLNNGVFTKLLGDGGPGNIHQFPIIDGSRIAIVVINIKGAAGDAFHALGNGKHLLADGLPHILVIGPGNTAELALAGDHIGGHTGIDAANGHDRSLYGVHPAGNDLLHGHHHLAGGQNRVGGFMRLGAMAANAVNGNVIKVNGSGHGTFSHANLADPALIGQDMDGIGRIHMGIFHDALLHQFLGTAGQSVFTVLEDQLHSAAEFVPQGAQQSGSTQQHGSVHIMAAGMHHVGHLAGKGQAGLLLHGQSVYIRPQGHAAARTLFAMDQRHDSGGYRGLDLIYAVFCQLFPDEGGGHELVAPDLRMPMDLPPNVHDLIIAGLGSFLDNAHIIASYYWLPKPQEKAVRDSVFQFASSQQIVEMPLIIISQLKKFARKNVKKI